MALTDKLSAIGEAIREKTGKTELLTLDEMPVEIAAIKAGGNEALTNFASGKSYTISRTDTPLTSQYSPISFKAGLTDGVADETSPINPENNRWFAFQTYYNTVIESGTYGTVGTITIDLGSSQNIKKVAIHLGNAKITASSYSFTANEPTKVEFLISSDNSSFTPVGEFETKAGDNIAYWSYLDNLDIDARYVRVAITINAPSEAAHYAIINEVQVLG